MIICLFLNLKAKILLYFFNSSPLKLLTFCFILFITGCSSQLPAISVNTQWGGASFNTAVDSEIAQYYLERYLQKQQNRPEFDQKIESLYQKHVEDLPDREILQQVSQEFSVDFAALFFADKLLKIKRNQDAQQLFYHYLAQVKKQPPRFENQRYLLLFVPGWDYQANGHITGADFALSRKQLSASGLENHLIPIPSNGGVEENAAHVAKAIEFYRHSGKALILVGASSANPAIHLALSELLNKEQQQAVKAWLNVGGILQGSPVIEHYQEWPLGLFLGWYCDYRGWKKEAVLSMSMQQRREKFKTLVLPKHILVFNYVGVAMSAQISYLAKDRYLDFREQGPNDGLTFLPDMLAPNSASIVAFGSDHFFAQDSQLPLKTVALAYVLLHYLP